MQKVSERMTCFVCEGGTGDAKDEDYIEVEVRFPAFDGAQRQFFGAHVACFYRVASPRHRIEIPR